MTDARRRVRRPARPTRRASASSPTLDEQGCSARQRAVPPHGAVLPPLRRAHRAADLAAVVLQDGRARRARRSRRVDERPGADPSPSGRERAIFDWLEDIRPWCMSRQLWWGHQLPVWYCGGDETHVRWHVGRAAATGEELAPRRGRARHVVQLGRCGRSRRSAGPSETPELRAFYPTDVLSTARDILFLWVARMVMMGLEFAGEMPFDDVYIHSSSRRPTGAGCRSRSAPASTRSTSDRRVPPTAPTPPATAC